MPRKSRSQPVQQTGGTDDLNDVHLWGQDQSPPGSYKIQLGYLELPKTITFKEKWLDTPYRFGNFHDANQEASRIFDGYVFRVSASNDRPHWDSPSYLHQPRRLSNTDPQWYDTFAVTPIRENRYAPELIMKEPPKLADRTQYSMDQLSKLKTVPGSSLKPVILDTSRSTQSKQSKQVPQNAQSAETSSATKTSPTVPQTAGRVSSSNKNLKSVFAPIQK